MNNDDSYSLMTKRFIKQIQSSSLVILVLGAQYLTILSSLIARQARIILPEYPPHYIIQRGNQWHDVFSVRRIMFFIQTY
jgi:hypothetical protein